MREEIAIRKWKMKYSPDNDWQDRTSVGYLRALVGIYETRHGWDEYPATKEACIQMLFDRVHMYAEHWGYTSYTHGWDTVNLPKNYTLKELVELAEEVFIGCKISLTSDDIKSTTSSSSNPPVVNTVYSLTIDWGKEPENGTTTNQ